MTGPPPVTYASAARALADATGRPYRDVKMPFFRGANASTEKARAMLGYNPQYTLTRWSRPRWPINAASQSIRFHIRAADAYLPTDESKIAALGRRRSRGICFTTEAQKQFQVSPAKPEIKSTCKACPLIHFSHRNSRSNASEMVNTEWIVAQTSQIVTDFAKRSSPSPLVGIPPPVERGDRGGTRAGG